MSYDVIQDAIDQGLGFAAAELGPPHNVYRITGTSTGNVIQPGNLIASGVNVFTKIAYGAGVRDSFESERMQGVLWYRVIADLRPYLVGDIFVVNDPIYGAGYSSVNFASTEFKGFALADHSPVKKALAGRITVNVSIFRPTAAPDSSGRWNKTKSDAQPVVLTSGVFSLGAVGAAAAQIPAGLVASGKSYGTQAFDKVPGEQRKSGWELYIPALNGFAIREGDHVIGPDGSRFIVVVPFTQRVGASGSQFFMEREAGPL